MEKQYIFVYLTTNTINGKQYVGDHSSDTINDEYLGSGYLLKIKLKEYGKENFERKILEFFNNREEAFNAQEKYIKQYNTLAPNGYNLSPKGGHNVKGCFSEETKKKLSISGKGKNKGQIPWNRGLKNCYTTEVIMKLRQNGKKYAGENNPMYGKKQSTESIKKMKKAKRGKNNPSFGTCWIYNSELKECKKINKEDIHLYKNWNKGRKMKF
jgi:group I intron endonuclease